MKTTGLIIFGIIVGALIIILIVVEIIEFTIGAILLGVAALIFLRLRKWIKSKID